MKLPSPAPLAGLFALAASLWAAGGAGAQPARTPDAPPAVTGQTVVPPSAPTERAEGEPAYSLDRPDWSLKQREDRLAELADSSLASGALDPAEAARVKAALAQIEASEDRARRRHDGELTDAETFRLEGRLRALAGDIHWARPPPAAAKP